jgi:hypothetical protein
MRRIILLWKTFKLLPKGNWLTVWYLEQYVFCITITYSQSLAFKIADLNFLTYRIKTDTAVTK